MKLSIAAKKKREAYIFILPGFIYLLIVCGYPLIYNIVLSFRNVNVRNIASGDSVFVGFENYIELFRDPTFLMVFRNTIIFTLACLVIQFTIGFLFAMFFSKKFTLAGPVRGLILVGYMMPMSVTALLGRNMFLLDGGVINDLLMKVGLIETGKAWISNPSTALPSLILAELWRGVPFFAISLLAAMQSIPTELYEAGKIDGANRWQSLIHITVPQLKETIVLTTLLRTVNEFNSVDLIYSLTGGGPVGRTTTVSILLANQATKSTNYGYGSAMSVICFIILAIFAVIYLKITRFGKEEN